MADQRQVDIILRDDVTIWNLWRKEEPDIRPDLSGAYLSGANLSGANLEGADLSEVHLDNANLSEANLKRANLKEAHLTNANLIGANLRGADLAEAYLSGANLSGAHLPEADLSGAYLIGANFIEANLSRTNLRGADLSEAYLSRTNLKGAYLIGANLSEAQCVRTNFSGATLTGCSVYGIAAWDLKLDDAKQSDLRITPVLEEANITVDNLEVAQFLYLLLSNPKVRTVLDTITSKVVLILGRFSEERKPVLDALREALRKHPNGYIPVLFDFEPQHNKPIFETVKTLANLARFIIADLTDPHMVRSELTYITANVAGVPVQPIMQRDWKLPPEYETWENSRSFLTVYRYVDQEQLLASLTEAVITPVEGHVRSRRLGDADSTK